VPSFIVIEWCVIAVGADVVMLFLLLSTAVPCEYEVAGGFSLAGRMEELSITIAEQQTIIRRRSSVSGSHFAASRAPVHEKQWPLPAGWHADRPFGRRSTLAPRECAVPDLPLPTREAMEDETHKRLDGE
jgi:hypothetical protein